MIMTPRKLHAAPGRSPEFLLNVMSELPEFWKGLRVANRANAIFELGTHQAVGRLSAR